ncbi:MAG: hypothetical protein Q9178_006201 [Gyalolechia marmorata]
MSTAEASTDVPHHNRCLRKTQHQRQCQGKTSDDLGGKEVDSSGSVRQNYRVDVLLELQTKKLLLDASLLHLQTAIDEVMDLRPIRDASIELLDLQETLRRDVRRLRDDLEGYRDIDPQQMEKKKKETALLKAKAEIWTTNIELLEGWLKKVLSMDPYQLECMRREYYKDEYVEGEGLKGL